MKKNSKLTELIIWFTAAVIGIVLIITGLNKPKEFFDKGGNSDASSICSESSQF